VSKNKELWQYEIACCELDFWYFAIRWLYTKDGNYYPSKRPFPADKEYMKVIFYIIENEVEPLKKYNLPDDLLKKIQSSRRFVICKSRRMIMTWLQMARILWKCWFSPNQSHAVQSKKKPDSEGLIGKRGHDFLTYMIENIDPMFKKVLGEPIILCDIIAFPNGSWVRAIPSGSEQLKQWTLTEWDADEAAKHINLAEALGASIPTLEGGGRALLWSSTKPGDFAEICDDNIGGKGNVASSERGGEEYHLLGCETCGGLKVKYNKWNEFIVIKLHYSADPEKDPCTEKGKLWLAKTRPGIPEDEWKQEYEIDAKAKSSSLIIYNFDPSVHVQDFDIDPEWTIYHALDIGIGAPTAGVWAGVDRENNIFVFDEYYYKDRTIQQNAIAIHGLEEEQMKMYKIGKPRIRLIDPSAFGRDYTGLSPAQHYAMPGQYQLIYIPGNNDLESGIETLRKYFQNTIDGVKPFILFKPHLKWTFFEFRNWILNEKTLKPRTKHDHLMSCLRYIVMAPAIFIEPDEEAKEEWVQYRNPLTGYVDYFKRKKSKTNFWED